MDGTSGDLIVALRHGDEITVSVRPYLTAKEIRQAAFLCASGAAQAERTNAAYSYMLGKVILEASQKEDFLSENGYEKFGDFLEELISTGCHRSTIYSWRPIVKKLPDLTTTQLNTIPHKSLRLIADHVPESKRAEMLDVAATVSVERFTSIAEDRGMIGPGDGVGAQWILSGSRDQIKTLRQYVERVDVAAFVGTSNVCEILLAMLGEVQSGEGWPKL